MVTMTTTNANYKKKNWEKGTISAIKKPTQQSIGFIDLYGKIAVSHRMAYIILNEFVRY